jgi:hypothetical protein
MKENEKKNAPKMRQMRQNSLILNFRKNKN